jgi:pimeloyl-ACP methyl ester carboxylesterase
MKKRIKYILLTLAALILVPYVAAATALYVYQRDLIYQPSQIVIDAPPRNTIYDVLPVKGADGARLMVWAAPATQPGLPTFVFFHGNASNVTDFAQMGEAFHRRGWGIVLAAYRGYSGNSGKPSEDGLMGDARAILSAIHPEGPVILWGHSLGSGVAARMASEGRAAALVLESPYTSLAELGARLYPIFPVRWLLSDPFDTAALVNDIKVPVLIFHSMDDPVVPFALGEKLAARFGDRATFVPLEGLGHFPHQIDLSEKVVEWLQGNGISH